MVGPRVALVDEANTITGQVDWDPKAFVDDVPWCLPWLWVCDLIGPMDLYNVSFHVVGGCLNRL